MTKKEHIKLLEAELEETREVAIDAINDLGEKLLVLDNELDRRLTIIHYLEDRLRDND